MVGLADYHLNVHFIKRTFEWTVLESFHGMKENAYVGYIRCDALGPNSSGTVPGV